MRSQARGSQEEERLAQLQLWAVSQSASTLIVDVKGSEPCRVAGVALRWRIDPTADSIEVTISDGTGHLRAEWAISTWDERLTPAPGMGLILEGVPVIEAGGDVVMLEPRIERASFPAVA